MLSPMPSIVALRSWQPLHDHCKNRFCRANPLLLDGVSVLAFGAGSGAQPDDVRHRHSHSNINTSMEPRKADTTSLRDIDILSSPGRIPNNRKSHPPMRAPAKPRPRLERKPNPLRSLFTINPARVPAARPITNQTISWDTITCMASGRLISLPAESASQGFKFLLKASGRKKFLFRPLRAGCDDARPVLRHPDQHRFLISWTLRERAVIT
jgi:hypothetical protein